MRMSVLGLSALVALGSMAQAETMRKSSIPAAGEVRVLDLGDGESVEFAWWPPGQGPRADASVRRIGPQPGLWAGGVEWRAVGSMAAVVEDGAWVARGGFTSAQRARILWPGAPATTTADVVMTWLNARVLGAGFALVPGAEGVIVRHCGPEANWRCSDLERRALTLGPGQTLELLRVPEGSPGSGFWVSPHGLTEEDRSAILWPGAPGDTAISNVVRWLNARVTGGGFAEADGHEQAYAPDRSGAVIVRRCVAGAGWHLAALERRRVELAAGIDVDMVQKPAGVLNAGEWIATQGLTPDQRAQILWPGAPERVPLSTAVEWLNARVADGGFAVVPGSDSRIVRRCEPDAVWRCADLEKRVLSFGEQQTLGMVRIPEGVPGGGCWVAQRGLTAADRAAILWPGAPEVTPLSEVLHWLNARISGGGFTEATSEEQRFTPAASGAVLVRRCGADAGWKQAALERRTVELGEGLGIEMEGLTQGLPGGGFWVASKNLTVAQRTRVMPEGLEAGSRPDVAAQLNLGVVGGGFAVTSSEGVGWLVRRCGAGVGWEWVERETMVDLVWCPPAKEQGPENVANSVGPLAANPIIVIKTSLGTIRAELWRDKAPVTVANVLRYVEAHFYDGLIFHRVIPGFMIQGGGLDRNMLQKPTEMAVKNEARSDTPNQRGTLSIARTMVVDSATSQFFINLVDNVFLNHKDRTSQGFGYCVFGKVVDGMDVVDRIGGVRTTSRASHADVPVEPVVIESIRCKP